MKKTKFVSSTIFLMFIASITLPSTIKSAEATYYSVNHNPFFKDSSCWTPDVWQASRSWHTHNVQNGIASTRAAIWGSVYEWGNTEFEQGKDPWATYGRLMYNPPLTSNLQLQTTARVTEKHVDWLFGQVNAYVEFWIEFTEPTGSHGYRWAELQIFLANKAGWFNPCLARQNSYHTRTVENRWYHVIYRGRDIGSSWTTRTYNVNGLIAKLANTWDVDLSKGKITCITFGVEGVKGEMTTQFDTVNFQINM